MIHLDPTQLFPDLSQSLIEGQATAASAADTVARDKTGAGSDFLGWMDPEALVTDAELAEIERLARSLRSVSDTMVVVGIGGSYLG
ncbi:MAG: glucose-6-phosphate isomerase, partial [Armatimonadota bacterium]